MYMWVTTEEEYLGVCAYVGQLSNTEEEYFGTCDYVGHLRTYEPLSKKSLTCFVNLRICSP